MHPPFPVNIPSRARGRASRIWEFQVHAQRSRGTIERWGSIGLLQTLHYAIVYKESLPFTLNQRHVVKYFLVEMPEYHGKEEGKEGVWCPATDARGLKCLGVQNICDKFMSILSLTCRHFEPPVLTKGDLPLMPILVHRWIRASVLPFFFLRPPRLSYPLQLQTSPWFPPLLPSPLGAGSAYTVYGTPPPTAAPPSPQRASRSISSRSNRDPKSSTLAKTVSQC